MVRERRQQWARRRGPGGLLILDFRLIIQTIPETLLLCFLVFTYDTHLSYYASSLFAVYTFFHAEVYSLFLFLQNFSFLFICVFFFSLLDLLETLMYYNRFQR